MAFKVNPEDIKNQATTDLFKNGNQLPIIFIPDGITRLRFFADSEGQIRRVVRRHKKTVPRTGSGSGYGDTYTVHLQCLESTPQKCPVCQYIHKKFEEYPGFEPKWEFESRNIVIAYAQIFSYEPYSDSTPRDKETIKRINENLNKPIVLMGLRKFLTEFSDQISQLPNDEIEKTFTPEIDHALWEIRSKNFGQNEFSISLNPKITGKMDPLPENTMPLSHVYYPEGVPPSPDLVASFLKLFDTSLSTYIRTIEPTITITPNVIQSLPPQSVSATPTPVSQIDQFNQQTNPVVSSVDSGGSKPLCYGRHRGADAECIICEYELDCKSAG